MKKKDEERVEFGNWCLKQCKPGYDSCQYRGDGIDWLELKRKCLIRTGKKRGKKDGSKARQM